jgi:hypothetical protein
MQHDRFQTSCLQRLLSWNSTGRSSTRASDISDLVNIARNIKHVKINIIIIIINIIVKVEMTQTLTIPRAQKIHNTHTPNMQNNPSHILMPFISIRHLNKADNSCENAKHIKGLARMEPHSVLTAQQFKAHEKTCFSEHLSNAINIVRMHLPASLLMQNNTKF